MAQRAMQSISPSPEVSILSRHRALVIGATALVGLILLELGAILRLNDGVLVFTLDDPYIHLALAENIARGHYGVNLEEPSAPSSSVIWPYLLAPFAASPSAGYVLFVLNCAFALATLLVYYRVLDHCLGRFHPNLTAALLVSLVVTTNIVGLVFTGMEHSLQLLLAATVAFGLAKESDTRQVSPWLVGAILVAPLVRYECLAVSLPAVGYLFLRRHFLLASSLLLAILILLGSFSLYLVSLGLEPLPTSVLLKSHLAAGQGHLALLFDNVSTGVRNDRGALLALCLLVFLARGLFAPDRRLLALAGAVAIGMHLVGGKYGWYNRYEIYIWGFSLLLLLALFGGHIRALLSKPGHSHAAKLAALAVAATLLIGLPYLLALKTLPIAANNIYEQQYQMHRFAAEFYRRPVAVNDLGYVSWRNDTYVLDLLGLASLSAMRSRLSGNEQGWMDNLVVRRGVGVAMVFDKWFEGQIPGSWIKLGELRLSRRNVTPLDSRVAFYATRASARDEADAALRRFASTLPGGVSFVFTQVAQ